MKVVAAAGGRLATNVWLWVGDGHVGKKWCVREIKEARCVIRHAIFHYWVVEDRRVEKKLTRPERADSEEVRNHRVNC